MSAREVKDFREFWPFYLSQHQNRICRALHFIGTWIALGAIACALYFKSPRLLIFAPLAGYGFAWVGHFIFEKNRPATFTYPLWSLRGDLKLFWITLTGKVDSELALSRRSKKTLHLFMALFASSSLSPNRALAEPLDLMFWGILGKVISFDWGAPEPFPPKKVNVPHCNGMTHPKYSKGGINPPYLTCLDRLQLLGIAAVPEGLDVRTPERTGNINLVPGVYSSQLGAAPVQGFFVYKYSTITFFPAEFPTEPMDRNYQLEFPENNRENTIYLKF